MEYPTFEALEDIVYKGTIIMPKGRLIKSRGTVLIGFRVQTNKDSIDVWPEYEYAKFNLTDKKLFKRIS